MALIPPIYLNTVVSIEVERTGQDGQLQKNSIATGFLFGKDMGEKDAEGKTLYSVFLITNRHVFEDRNRGAYLQEVHLRFNVGENQGTKYYKVYLLNKDGQPRWIRHPNENVDIAIIPINGAKLNQEGIHYYFFREDADVLSPSQFKEIGMTTGDGVFVLGFPLGIRGNTRNFVIARQGIIARIDEEILKDYCFLIDAPIFPGNSGGPVILKPELTAIQGTKSVNRAALIGVISQSITYPEVAVSEQTGRPRIIFEDQTGLTAVVSIDFVLEAINIFFETRKTSKSKENIDKTTSVYRITLPT